MAPRKQKETIAEKTLRKLYYDPRSPTSYGGRSVLEEALQQKLKNKRNINIPLVVKKWLENQPTYTLHKLPQKNFTRRRVIVGGLNKQWQADLMDLQAFAKINDGMRYVLLALDCFSRKAWARALKNKSGKSVAAAFSDIFKDQNPPSLCQSDLGLEFYNAEVKALFKKHGVKLFSVKNAETKACMVERLIRTIKRRMYGYFYAKRTRRWVDVLQDLLHAYNTKVHSVIKIAPNEVNESNAHVVRRNNRYNRGKGVKLQKHRITVGDLVRITAAGHVFKKKYLPQWTEEIFKVHQIYSSTPNVFVLKDMAGEVVEGTFYSQELQKVTALPELHEIDEILERKGSMILVSWKGYPRSMAQWIKKSSLKTL